MRLLLRLVVLVLGLFAIATAALAGSALAAPADSTGYYIFKDMRAGAVTEFRDRRGKLVSREAHAAHKGERQSACGDPRYKLAGGRWRDVFPSYLVNVRSSAAAGLDESAALADLVSAHAAWTSPLVTDCQVPRSSAYQQHFAGPTEQGASTALLELDGLNVVEFRSLSGTFCDGAVACVVVYSEKGRFLEADMALEADAGRFGPGMRWSTGDRTDQDEFAVVDVATHEWGHFAGLDHVEKSPELTMFPFIHDGMQTLGLGDVRGIRTRY
jgi:matrixin